MTTNKTCTRCGEVKDLKGGFAKSTRDGHSSACRVCLSLDRNDPVRVEAARRRTATRKSEANRRLAAKIKPCTYCGREKPFEEFNVDKKRTDGRNARCRVCATFLQKTRRALNPGPEVLARKEKKEREERSRQAAQRKPCSACSVNKPFSEYTKAGDKLYPQCKECHNKASGECKRKARTADPEKVRAKDRERYAANPGVRLATVAKRRAAKLQRTPAWADLKAIEQVYIDRPEGNHVDHEIPLQGKLVSGLHVEGNLQYLTGPDNMSKGNSFNPDDWYWVAK